MPESPADEDAALTRRAFSVLEVRVYVTRLLELTQPWGQVLLRERILAWEREAISLIEEGRHESDADPLRSATPDAEEASLW